MSAQRPFLQNIVAEDTDGWQEPREILGGESERVGVIARNGGASVRNGEVHDIDELGLYLGPAEMISGDVVVLSDDVVEEPFEQLGHQVIAREQRNDAGFYTGLSDGVETFEAKCDQNYDIYDAEAPHIHNSAEAYSPRGGSFLLAMAGPGYDFNTANPDSWAYRDDIVFQEVAEGEVFEVPSGVPHRVAAQFDSEYVPKWISGKEDQETLNEAMNNLNDDEPDHIVIRYGEELGKYDLEGKPMNQWTDGSLSVDQMNTYNSEGNKKVSKGMLNNG